MDIKKQVEQLVAKVSKDKSLVEKFQKDPKKTVQSLVNVDLPTDQLDNIIDGVKAKIKVDQAGDLLDKAKGLFDK